MKHPHDAPVLLIGLILPVSLAADAATPGITRARTAALSVGATVVRPSASPSIAIKGDEILVSNPGGVGVSVEGGRARPAGVATVRIEPERGNVTRITLTY